MKSQTTTSFRFNAQEFVGSLGDIGTLLPLLTGLIVFNGLHAGRALALVGITYIFVGIYYRLPVPVQPLKAAAVIAIATGASIGQIQATAFWMAAILLVLGMARLADKLDDFFPKFLIQGLQFGLGLMMIRSGLKFVLSYPDGLAAILHGSRAASAHPGIAGFLPSTSDFTSAFFLLVLPQLPLTLGNAVIATRDCAHKYFPAEGRRVTAGRLATTIGIGNLAAALVGGLPVCHGAGGMTAHYHFGARSGAAGVMLGAMLLAAGLIGGHPVTAILAAAPAWVLGAPLAYVGIRHAMLARGALREPATAFAVLAMGAVGYLQGNLLAALILGMAVKVALGDVPSLFKCRLGWFRLVRGEVE